MKDQDYDKYTLKEFNHKHGIKEVPQKTKIKEENPTSEKEEEFDFDA